LELSTIISTIITRIKKRKCKMDKLERIVWKLEQLQQSRKSIQKPVDAYQQGWLEGQTYLIDQLLILADD